MSRDATLALIGAIVAEFFGTPIVGMGFRISIEAARLSLDMVWAVQGGKQEGQGHGQAQAQERARIARRVGAHQVALDRTRLLPVANVASALPIVGIAPIMVMWFGFDWPSKAAVVAVMTARIATPRPDRQPMT
jgi:ABC-type nitrate/sulfonate/bicarbonate transport system permease component